MNDGIMYVWQVMIYEPYEGSYAVHICARKETAEYLRDWCEAIEEQRCIDVAGKNKWKSYVGNKNVFEVEESEVIL